MYIFSSTTTTTTTMLQRSLALLCCETMSAHYHVSKAASMMARKVCALIQERPDLSHHLQKTDRAFLLGPESSMLSGYHQSRMNHLVSCRADLLGFFFAYITNNSAFRSTITDVRI